MYRISFFALVVAFLAEIGVDILSHSLLFYAFASGSIQADMGDAEFRQLYDTVSASSAFTLASLLLGSATTIGGGYFAARLARRYPYYHGLAMGLIGIAFTLYLWREQPLWLGLLSVVTNIPLCIYGAHLARRHMPPAE